MAALKELLPPAMTTTAMYYDHSNYPWFKQRFSSTEGELSSCFVPRKVEDFGDSGLSQATTNNVRYSLSNHTLPAVTINSHGIVDYNNAIVKQNENASKIEYSQYKELVPKILRDEEETEVYAEPEQKEIDDTTRETKSMLEKIVNVRLGAAPPKNVHSQQPSDSKFIKYKPSQKSAAFNSGGKERIIRMVEMPVDTLEPPKFKHRRVPKASCSPPFPVMHSPQRPVTVKDQQDWKIPPCISNWKNPKGYTIPLDKRLASDGRDLQEVQINDNFAKLSETFYVAEQKAREAVAMRSKLQMEMLMKENEKKEQELLVLAQKARFERIGLKPADASLSHSENRADKRGDCERVREKDKDFPNETMEEKEEWLQRERIREDRRRERERRLEAKDAAILGKKRKITRDRDRDISEKVALGMASIGAGKGGEVMYDQRLFNQEKGIYSGFATDDQYDVYDKGLFTAQQPTLSTLYKPKKDVDADMYDGADEQLDKILNTNQFKPDKGFTGAFEKAEESDPFGLDRFLTEVKEGKKVLEKAGTIGTMAASAGASMRDGYDGGSGRTRVGFERGQLLKAIN